MTKEKAKIVSGGQGGFLNPPGHPEHSFHVETDLRRRQENRGSMSLSHAKDCEYLDDEVRHEARLMLFAWLDNPPALDSSEVKDWIAQVLGYFRNCYKGPGNDPECWAATNLDIVQYPGVRDEMENIDKHAGVHLIRQYYPDFMPTTEDFKNAYWGKKKEVA